MLKWLRSQTPPRSWDCETTSAAAACAFMHQCGNLPVLKWLRAQSPPCPCDGYAIERALDNTGSLDRDIVDWLRANGAPEDREEDEDYSEDEDDIDLE
jgi:hypothetical protein